VLKRDVLTKSQSTDPEEQFKLVPTTENAISTTSAGGLVISLNTTKLGSNYNMAQVRKYAALPDLVNNKASNSTPEGTHLTTDPGRIPRHIRDTRPYRRRIDITDKYSMVRHIRHRSKP
jgi:hypothetical protein